MFHSVRELDEAIAGGGGDQPAQLDGDLALRLPDPELGEVLLAAVGLGLHLGWFYWLGVVAVAALLAYEHSLVRPGDLRRLDAAFFTVNGVISVVFFAFVLAEAAL